MAWTHPWTTTLSTTSGSWRAISRCWSMCRPSLSSCRLQRARACLAVPASGRWLPARPQRMLFVNAKVAAPVAQAGSSAAVACASAWFRMHSRQPRARPRVLRLAVDLRSRTHRPKRLRWPTCAQAQPLAAPGAGSAPLCTRPARLRSGPLCSAPRHQPTPVYPQPCLWVPRRRRCAATLPAVNGHWAGAIRRVQCCVRSPRP